MFARVGRQGPAEFPQVAAHFILHRLATANVQAGQLHAPERAGLVLLDRRLGDAVALKVAAQFGVDRLDGRSNQAFRLSPVGGDVLRTAECILPIRYDILALVEPDGSVTYKPNPFTVEMSLSG